MKGIIVRETSVYHQAEQIVIHYVTYPQRGPYKLSVSNKDIGRAFIFDPKSLLLKYHPEEQGRRHMHVNYGNGIGKTEWIYVDKEPNDESFPGSNIRKNMKIKVNFPTVIKDSNNERIIDN